MKSKRDLPSKTCATCGRPFVWRKRWKKCWEQVRYCSKRCRGGRSKSSIRGALILLCLSWVPRLPATEPPPSAGAQVHGLFAGYALPDSPGVAVMVIGDGEVLHEAGYGLANLETGEPITPDTAFRLASVSKQFTAMALMRLAERGKLGYDDAVVEHLPELGRFGERITVRHLLNHTGGLPDYYDALAAASGDSMPTNQDALQFLASWGEPLFSANERYEYSNPGYEMLALIVERVSGKPFGSFLEEEIFAPLGMDGTVVFDQREPAMPRRAYGYSRREDSGFELDDANPLNHIIGSGGVYSSLRDLYRWDQALYGEQLVSRATLEEGWRPARLADGSESPYGFGWRLGSYGPLGPRIAHAGGWVGFSTYILRYPEQRLSVILLSNLADFDGERFADRITDIYYPSRLIRGATVLDGTGASGRRADVRIRNGRITDVGEFAPAAGDLVVEAAGLVLAPGFVDAHSHADSDILNLPAALAAVSQGITTVVVGQDGDSQLPLADFFAALEQQPPAVNVASYSGHGTLRQRILGDDFRRPATAVEVERMEQLLEADLAAGALGLSTGLEYDPGIYSATEEVAALARFAARRGGRYISHIRSEDRRFWPAIDEAVEIGGEAGLPVQISHIKLAQQSLHGASDRLLARLDAARAAGVDVTADLYPYTYWQSTLTVMFPDRDYDDLDAATFAVTELSSPEGMLIPVFAPEPALAGKTLAEIAALRGTDSAATLIDLIRQAEAMRATLPDEERDGVENVIATSMLESDIERLMKWPHTVFCTDGGLDGTHPRGFGSFPRILGHYVRERGVLTLEEAVHRMTAQAALQLGIAERGWIAPGQVADLVLFDPASILDRATTDDPQALSDGVASVWVSGQLVFESGHATTRRPGAIIRRQPAVASTDTAPAAPVGPR